MLRNFVLCALVAVLCSCLPYGGTTVYIDNKSNISHLQNATVALVMSDVDAITDRVGPLSNSIGQDNMTYCAGFFVDSTTIVTANHCTGSVSSTTVQHVVQFKVVTYSMYKQNAGFSQYVVFDMGAFDETTDIAILKLHPGQRAFDHDSLSLSDVTPHTGDRVYAMGHPVQHHWVLTEGRMTVDVLTEENAHWVEASADIFFGNSGGPLVDNEGHVLGVCHSISHMQSYLGRWAYVDGIRKLLHQ